MKNLALATGLLAATSLASLANAASGVISFTGALTAASCTVDGGDGTGGPTSISVAMGTVSIDELSDGSGSDFGNETSIPVGINCANAGGIKTVSMRFAPHSGSGVDTVDGRLLKIVTGDPDQASGVGIGLIDSDNKLINMSGTAESLPVSLVITPGTSPDPDTATARLIIRAAYIKAVSGSDVPKPGAANGTLPFTLTYK